jgi:hypothetical protein
VIDEAVVKGINFASGQRIRRRIPFALCFDLEMVLEEFEATERSSLSLKTAGEEVLHPQDRHSVFRICNLYLLGAPVTKPTNSRRS